ncbi:1-deoxy-D-xylulose-5-phosphate reductoisomerase [Treponema sp. OMZ 840]|uniref:1-deoxy-D-xylulose-5-phosphate reductoisomerase n=1 Tax=Treponema sp. OMZ 840 TaxID=244313 RepID=UPI003D8BF4D1
MKKKVLVLGCTGSIGTSTLDIIRSFPDRFEVCGLSAHRNEKKLKEAAAEFGCKNTALTGTEAEADNTAVHRDLSAAAASNEKIAKLIEKSGADIAVNGIAGAAGLMPSVLCLKNGIDLALANKETIVMAGHLIEDFAKKNGRRLIPVDSEHSALFALIERFGKKHIDSLILTASGGPFRTWTRDKIEKAQPEDALKHPTWNMGQKISIDSASLANKGLEVIEACRLFDMEPEKVKVTVHPQSLVHSLIETVDGDLYAQISEPDMKRPIISALTYPEMIENNLKKLDLFSALGNPDGNAEGVTMSFFPARFDDFPLLGAAYKAQKRGASYTIAYNAANEVAVSLFLEKKLSFTGIAETVLDVLSKDWSGETQTFEDVFETDKKVRIVSLEAAEKIGTKRIL